MSLLTGRVSPLAVKRKLGSIPFVSGGQQAFEIAREGVLLTLWLRLQFTITNGGTGPVGPLFMTLARLLKRLEITVGGRDTVMNVTGPLLAARVYCERGLHASGMADTVVLTNSAATVYDVSIPIDFTLPNGRRQDDTGLDTRGLNQLTLMLTWGTVSDFFTTLNAATVGTVTCNVEGEYLLNVPADKPFLVRSLDTVERELTGSTDTFELVMDRGTGLVYRTFMVCTTADNIGVNTILNTATGSIRLECGSFVDILRDPVLVQAENRLAMTAAPLTGVYYIDPMHDGQLVTALDTTNIPTDLVMKFSATKVTGTNFITVQREAVRPLKLR